MADIKISEMLQETTPEDTDLLPMVRTSATSGKNRKIAMGTLFSNVPSRIITNKGISSGGWQTVAVTGAMTITNENVQIDVGATPINIIVPDGTSDGQVILFLVRSSSANCNVTPVNAFGFSSALLTAVGKTVSFMWHGPLSKWIVIGYFGATIT